MFRIMFNTAFIRSNILILTREDIDIMWNAKERYPKDFRAEVKRFYLLYSAVSEAIVLICPKSAKGFLASVEHIWVVQSCNFMIDHNVF